LLVLNNIHRLIISGLLDLSALLHHGWVGVLEINILLEVHQVDKQVFKDVFDPCCVLFRLLSHLVSIVLGLNLDEEVFDELVV